MPVSDSRKAANRKWDAENMTILACKVRKTYADAVKAKAAREGTTPNAIIKSALDDFLGDEKPGKEQTKMETEPTYTIKPEFVDAWNTHGGDENQVTASEVERLSREWGIPVSELLDQLEEN